MYFIQRSACVSCVCVSVVTRAYLEMEIALSQDQISKYADKILLYTNTCMKELRRLFLVQDLVDSLKVCLTVIPSKQNQNNLVIHENTITEAGSLHKDMHYVCFSLLF